VSATDDKTTPASETATAPEGADVQEQQPDQAVEGQESASAEGESVEQTPPPKPPPDPRELRIRFLEGQLVEKEQTLHTYIKAHKKAEQEFEAFRNRLLRDQEREVLAAKGKVVEKMLDIDENLERTIDATARGASVESLLEGVKLIHRMFLERLTELGLERWDPTGEPFDPNTMQALGVVPVKDPAQADRVVMTLKAGFRLGDREVRPALVQVGKLM